MVYNIYSSCPTLRPKTSVKHPIIDRFIQMQRLDIFAVVEVGDGAGDAEDFVVGAGGKAEFGHRGFQEVLTFVAQLAEFADLSVGHLRVVANLAAVESSGLTIAALGHLRTHRRARRAGCAARKLFEGDRGNFDVNVDAVQKGAADLAHVAFDLRRSAVALAAGVGPIAAGARIKRGDEHEICRKRRAV